MIFLFAPPLLRVTLILVIVLREQFTFRRPVSMLEEIHAELCNRRAEDRRRNFEAEQRILADRESRLPFGMLEFRTTPAPAERAHYVGESLATVRDNEELASRTGKASNLTGERKSR